MVQDTEVEAWGFLDDYDKKYMVSDEGRFYDRPHDRLVATSFNNYGHMKVNLVHPKSGKRETKSVRRLVAQKFVVPPNRLCDEVAVLDGNLSNMRSDNLAWRPRWFVWKYAHQLKNDQPNHFHNLAVRNTSTGLLFGSIVHAGIHDGVLFSDVWLSIHQGNEIFPYGDIYEIG